MAVEDDGDLVVADSITSGVIRVDATTGQQAVIDTGGVYSNPVGIAVEDDGGLIVGQNAFGNPGSVLRQDASGGAPSVLSTGGLLVDTNAVAVVRDGPPAAVDASYAASAGVPLTASPPGVLAGASDPDGDAVTAVLVAGPSHGTVALAPDGSFTYTPGTGYSGPDSFTFRASDGTLTSPVRTVSIDVRPDGDPPTVADGSYSTREDTPLTVDAPGALTGALDPDGDAVTAVLETGPAHGTLELAADGSFTYAPAANHTGSDAFTFRATDGTFTSRVATVAIRVRPVNDAPRVAVVPGGTCEADGTSASVLLRVSDIDSPLTSVSVTASSANGVVLAASGVSVTGGGATRTLSLRGSGRAGGSRVLVTASDGRRSAQVPIGFSMGGNGPDTVDGTRRDDVLLGRGGRDVLSGGGGNDLLCGGRGADVVRGEAGDDTLWGGAGRDRFSGGPGSDQARDLGVPDGDTQDGTIP
ncbi:MAG: Ig-like domain-containing protein [Thermoleophilia bacterium]